LFNIDIYFIGWRKFPHHDTNLQSYLLLHSISASTQNQPFFNQTNQPTLTMDSYPQFDVSERECSSRRDSNSSSITKAMRTLDTKTTQNGHLAPPQYTSFPSPSAAAEQERLRNDSVHSTSNTETKIAAEYAQYTDAPPPYSSKQYEGKSEEQQHKMRIADYAKELKRQMGRQLVKGLKSGETTT
jgi:hypothetical protein